MPCQRSSGFGAVDGCGSPYAAVWDVPRAPTAASSANGSTRPFADLHDHAGGWSGGPGNGHSRQSTGHADDRLTSVHGAAPLRPSDRVLAAAPLFPLLLLVFDRPWRIHWLRRGLPIARRQLPGLLAVELEDPRIRHRLDEEIAHCPDQRIDPIW